MSAVSWGCVRHTAERVAIVASGSSLKNVRLVIPDGVTVIAVNSGIRLLPSPPHFWFTLDTSRVNRAIMAAPLHGTTYYAAVFDDYGTETAVLPSDRDPPEPHVIFLRRIHGKGHNRARHGLSEDPTGIHASNSGYGALNLAYLMTAKRIAILGVDCFGGYAHNDGKPKGGLFYVPRLFATAKPQLERRGAQVIVGSPNSKVKCWDRTTPRDALAWLAS